jgi:hypothetical protein
MTAFTWTDRFTILGAGCAVLAGTWTIYRTHEEDMRVAKEWFRQDQKEARERWDAIEKAIHARDIQALKEKNNG